jgi:hypothetical protein
MPLLLTVAAEALYVAACLIVAEVGDRLGWHLVWRDVSRTNER